MKKSIGLTRVEAQKKLLEVGNNEIVAKPLQTPLQILFAQFTSILIILLILASIASILLGDVLDGIFILLIVILNGILGFVQEYKAEKAIAALKKMTISTIRVVRNGIEQKIDSKSLVPGDVIFLEEGDKIPADCEIIESLHFEVNEASLTGESMAIKKNMTDTESRHIFLGTIAVKGRAKAMVIATGMNTRFGKIAYSLSQIKSDETPLQKKLNVLGKQLGFLAIGASFIVFIIGILKNYQFMEMVFISISLAVAAVPEGLPAVITITLAVGMQRMARKQAILRKLSSIEALGNATVIATDKTGTLTRNEMQVVKFYIDREIYLTSKTDVDFSTKSFASLLKTGILCNNASLREENENKYTVLGDTTEGALLLFGKNYGQTTDKVKNQGKLIEEFAFDPNEKKMSVVWEDDLGRYIYSKGAPESMLERCIEEYPNQKEEIKQTNIKLASEGLRVLALAYRKTSTVPKNRADAEKDLTFIGLVGIADPHREEVEEALVLAESAGIRTVMITGDNELTAKAIGISIGLIKEGDRVVTGREFDEMSDSEAKKLLDSIRIFARTNPDHKLRVVRLLQEMGHVVVVTGDGVNDALAIKKADVGVAMGITGTDVAKEASDMVITDDNYATLVVAVEEGRIIFDNIKSAIKYLVGCNVGEVVAVLIGMLLGWPLILTPLQLLYVNLVTDGLPAIALAVSPKSEDIMKRKPRKNNSLFGKHDIPWFVEISFFTAFVTLAAFFIGYRTGDVVMARTLAFCTIVLVQQFILLDVWARNRSAFKKSIFTNKIFLFNFTFPLVLQFFIVYFEPLTKIFKTTQISLDQIGIVIMLSCILLIVSEIRKFFNQKVVNNSNS